MRVMKIKRGKRQDKPFLSENEVWCSQHCVMVVARQLVSQWVVLEGRPQQAKSGRGKNGKSYNGRWYKRP